MRRGGPLRPIGRRGLRLKPARDEASAIAREREDQKCENCRLFGYLEPAHAFGRGNQISEPMASWPECYAMLCRSCHRSYDNEHGPKHEAIKQKIGWLAVYRLIVRTEIGIPMPIGDPDCRPLDAARHIERTLKERGEL